MERELNFCVGSRFWLPRCVYSQLTAEYTENVRRSVLFNKFGYTYDDSLNVEDPSSLLGDLDLITEESFSDGFILRFVGGDYPSQLIPSKKLKKLSNGSMGYIEPIAQTLISELIPLFRKSIDFFGGKSDGYGYLGDYSGSKIYHTKRLSVLALDVRGIDLNQVYSNEWSNFVRGIIDLNAERIKSIIDNLCENQFTGLTFEAVIEHSPGKYSWTQVTETCISSITKESNTRWSVAINFVFKDRSTARYIRFDYDGKNICNIG